MEESGGVNEQISDRAEELSEGSRESQAFVDNGFGRVQDTIRKMDEIKTSNIQTLEEIGGLAEQISSIGDIIDIINNIANQTRIIAFNAELEASSAGAAGTSFRIVAEEIRRLANNTVEALVGIKGRISDIQQSSERLIGSSEEGTAKIDEGIQISAGLNDIFMNIRISAENTAVSAEGITAVLKEQTSSYDRVFTTLKQISEGSEQALAASRISGAEVEKLRILLDELKSLLSKFDFDTEHAVFNFTRS
jgi:methyl-accepting chemotaxis protein